MGVQSSHLLKSNAVHLVLPSVIQSFIRDDIQCSLWQTFGYFETNILDRPGDQDNSRYWGWAALSKKLRVWTMMDNDPKNEKLWRLDQLNNLTKIPIPLLYSFA